MSNRTRVLMMTLSGVLGLALLAGCGTPDQRWGKGNDHEVANLNNRTVYVEKEPRVVYVQQPAPSVVYYETAPVYYSTSPVYTTTPVYSTRTRLVPVTRYYYYRD